MEKSGIGDNEQAVQAFEEAREYFTAQEFKKAESAVARYRFLVDYDAFERWEGRPGGDVRVSVVIVSHAGGGGLLECLDSLDRQNTPGYEIIVVDNGGNESVRERLLERAILYIRAPMNLLPSEGRNVGAHFSRGEYIAFVDDDAVVDPGYVGAVLDAFERFDFLAIRGRVLPKTTSGNNAFPGHCDLGPYPVPAVLETEGNMAFRVEAYRAVGGMNPLVFGAEGVEITFRCFQRFPGKDIYYWPALVIRHDFAGGEALGAKKRRHALAAAYFKHVCPEAVDLAIRYGSWYQSRPGPRARYDRRSFAQKLRAAVWELSGSLWLKRGAKVQGSPGKYVDPDSPGAMEEEATGRSTRARMNPEAAILPADCKTPGRDARGSPDAGAPPEAPMARELEKELRKLRSELEAVRNSLSFRLGLLVGETVTSPVHRGFRFPLEVARLFKEHLEWKAKAREGTAKAAKRAERPLAVNRKAYVRPGVEEHRFDAFAEARPLRQSRISSLRVAAVLSGRMEACLDPEVQLESLPESGWRERLEAIQPELLLVESAWSGAGGDWKHLATEGSRANAALREVLAFCRKHGIPTAFWDTEDRTQVDLLRDTASMFDYVFAADPASAQEYEKEIGCDRTGFLPPAVQPALHNPVRLSTEPFRGRVFPFVYNGWADLLENPADFKVLLSLLDRGLHVVESRYRMVANKLGDLPEFRENVMGCLNSRQLATALKHYRVCLMLEPSLSSPLTLVRQAMEAVACGAAVVWRGTPREGIPEDAVNFVSSDDDLLRIAATYAQDDYLWAATTHQRRRVLYRSHTYSHRMRELCRKLDLEFPWDEHPKVTVITPTKRPELLERSLRIFDAQKYPNKEWIVVINRGDIDTAALERRLGNRPDVRVFRVHEEKNIGFCLNLGIEKAYGRYWFKMDDDDFYGPNYISDMMLNVRSVDADIFGKATGFIYFEGEDAIYLRSNFIDAQHVVGSDDLPHLCGATICGKIDTERHVCFSEEMRACVDTHFLRECGSKGLTIYVADPFNFVAMRNADKLQHTWRADDDLVKRNAVRFQAGNDVSRIMI